MPGKITRAVQRPEFKKTHTLWLLVEEKYLTHEQHEVFKAECQKRDVYPIRLLLTGGYISRRHYADFCKLFLNYPHVKLFGRDIDRSLVTILKQTFIMRNFVLPIELNGNELVVAMLDPHDEELKKYIEKQTGYKVKPVFATDVEIAWQFHRLFGKTLVHRSVYDLFWKSPEESAALVVTRRQIVFLIVLTGIFLLALTFNPIAALVVLTGAVNLFYMLSVLFKFALTLAGARYEMTEHVSRQELRELKDEELPVYTILVPLYKEAEMLPQIARSLKDLEYPKDKLDIKLLLEENDHETLQAMKQLSTPATFDFVIVPDFGPKTKPKACNYGLYLARGKYVTIYDAEDFPEPDQLKKIVALFKKEPDEVVCIQASLNYYNANENFLTRMFTLEYSYWFDYMLRGLDRFKLPIPLGGTSNHFKVDRLRELGGWDPFNVTEDADLGVRAYSRGYKIAVIDSTTFEEANNQFGNWIRQRSRWVKGYMITWLVHMRSPFQLMKNIGWKGFLGFNFFIGGTPFIFLVNPLLWIAFISWLVFDLTWMAAFFPPIVLYISLFNLLLGNLILIYMNMVAVFKRKAYPLTIYGLLNPVYWLFHAIAAYKALWQLIRDPFYWEKTTHGTSKVTAKQNGNGK